VICIENSNTAVVASTEIFGFEDEFYPDELLSLLDHTNCLKSELPASLFNKTFLEEKTDEHEADYDSYCGQKSCRRIFPHQHVASANNEKVDFFSVNADEVFTKNYFCKF
jgi:hypothetical protein